LDSVTSVSDAIAPPAATDSTQLATNSPLAINQAGVGTPKESFPSRMTTANFSETSATMPATHIPSLPVSPANPGLLMASNPVIPYTPSSSSVSSKTANLMSTVLSHLYPKMDSTENVVFDQLCNIEINPMDTSFAPIGCSPSLPGMSLMLQPDLCPPEDLVQYFKKDLGIELDIYCPSGWSQLRAMPSYMVAASVDIKKHPKEPLTRTKRSRNRPKLELLESKSEKFSMRSFSFKISLLFPPTP
jgi:hypothetical protein